MLPLLGPSTARDTVGLVGDYFTDPEFYIFNHTPGNYIVFGTRVINLRANLLRRGPFFDGSGRPVLVPARRVPATPAQPDLRRQPASGRHGRDAAPQDAQGNGRGAGAGRQCPDATGQMMWLAISALMMTAANAVMPFFTSRGGNVSVVPDQISVSLAASNKLVSAMTTLYAYTCGAS